MINGVLPLNGGLVRVNTSISISSTGISGQRGFKSLEMYSKAVSAIPTLEKLVLCKGRNPIKAKFDFENKESKITPDVITNEV